MHVLPPGFVPMTESQYADAMAERKRAAVSRMERHDMLLEAKILGRTDQVCFDSAIERVNKAIERHNNPPPPPPKKIDTESARERALRVLKASRGETHQ
jgi:hypothetical protein